MNFILRLLGYQRYQPDEKYKDNAPEGLLKGFSRGAEYYRISERKT